MLEGVVIRNNIKFQKMSFNFLLLQDLKYEYFAFYIPVAVVSTNICSVTEHCDPVDDRMGCSVHCHENLCKCLVPQGNQIKHSANRERSFHQSPPTVYNVD